MTRFVNSTAQTAADQPHVVYALLVQLDFVSGFVRVFNGTGTLVFNGNTYQGLGQYGSINQIGESIDMKPSNPLTLQLSGLPDGASPALAAAATNRADYYGRSARIDIALFDSNRNIMTPIENMVWEGRMDSINVVRSNNTLQLTCEDRMIIWDKAIGFLYSTEWQALLYPGDTFFDQVPFLANRLIHWGGANTPGAPPPAGGTPGGGGGRTQPR